MGSGKLNYNVNIYLQVETKYAKKREIVSIIYHKLCFSTIPPVSPLYDHYTPYVHNTDTNIYNNTNNNNNDNNNINNKSFVSAGL